MYYDKYIKYKTKYLELKNNFPVNLENIQFGGKKYEGPNRSNRSNRSNKSNIKIYDEK